MTDVKKTICVIFREAAKEKTMVYQWMWSVELVLKETDTSLGEKPKCELLEVIEQKSSIIDRT